MGAKSFVRMACTATNHLVHMRTIQQRNSDSENRACMDHSASNSGVAMHTHLDVDKSASLVSGVPTNPVASYTLVQCNSSNQVPQHRNASGVPTNHQVPQH